MYFNAAFNTALFVAVTLPLAFSRRYFVQPDAIEPFRDEFDG